MSGWSDLIDDAQPALVAYPESATAGRTWRFTLVDFEDDDGNVVDLSSGITGTCTVYSGRDGKGSALLSLTVTPGADGSVVLSADATDTAGLASAGTSVAGSWGLVLTDSGPSPAEELQVFLPSDSPFDILSGD